MKDRNDSFGVLLGRVRWRRGREEIAVDGVRFPKDPVATEQRCRALFDVETAADRWLTPEDLTDENAKLSLKEWAVQMLANSKLESGRDVRSWRIETVTCRCVDPLAPEIIIAVRAFLVRPRLVPRPN